LYLPFFDQQSPKFPSASLIPFEAESHQARELKKIVSTKRKYTQEKYNVKLMKNFLKAVFEILNP